MSLSKSQIITAAALVIGVGGAIFLGASLASNQNAMYEKERSVMADMEAERAQQAADNLKAAQDFLAENRTKPGVTQTASGLQYAVISSGPANGPRPTATSQVVVNYRGKLLDGTEFDSSYRTGQAAVFEVGQLIPAWVEALQLMRPGDEWTLWVPPELGYGEMGAGDQIGPNALLVFTMRLEEVVGAGDSGEAGVTADKGATR